MFKSIGRFTNDNRNLESCDGLNQVLGGSRRRGAGSCAVELIDDDHGRGLRGERSKNVSHILAAETEILLNLLQVRRNSKSYHVSGGAGRGPIQEPFIRPIVET